jgi:hypothetical protein
MDPIGLTCKKDGEIMIVHLCLNCGKTSKNRIAGDDNTHEIMNLLDKNSNLTHWHQNLLTRKDKDIVLTALFGYDYPR